MPNKLRWYGLLIYSTGELIYSRDRHDFHGTRPRGDYYIDGGNDYVKVSTPVGVVKGRDYDIVEFSLPDGVSAHTLHNDWNYSTENFGWTTFEKANIDGPVKVKGVQIDRIADGEPIFLRPGKSTIGLEPKEPIIPKSMNIHELRKTLNDDVLEDLSYTLKWGTFGLNGDQPRVDKPLRDLDTDHLENILVTQRHIAWQTSLVILHILKDRYINQW
jgi:hypothetical protein